MYYSRLQQVVKSRLSGRSAVLRDIPALDVHSQAALAAPCAWSSRGGDPPAAKGPIRCYCCQSSAMAIVLVHTLVPGLASTPGPLAFGRRQ